MDELMIDPGGEFGVIDGGARLICYHAITPTF